MDAVTVIFVLFDKYRDENEAAEIMHQAVEACNQNEVKTLWLREIDLPNTELKKTDFIVFENFDGKDFSKIMEKKSASILGPWCILVCLLEGKKIPNFQWPIYNVAMYNCIVTTTVLSKTAKMDIRQKIQSMGGIYSDGLTAETTHLIANSVKSAKYMHAIDAKIKIVTPEWVDAVWNMSQQANIHCNDTQFDKFICPPFRNLVICSTNITSPKERDQIKKFVVENGGQFTEKLQLKTTDFLICGDMVSGTSEKYKEARKTKNINCVTLQWLHDSVQEGYCLSSEKYSVKKTTSTPQKELFINPNFSTISAIDQSKNDRTAVDDTLQILSKPFNPNSYCLSSEKYSVKKTTSTPRKELFINPNSSTISAIDQSKNDRIAVDDALQILSNSFNPNSNGVKRKNYMEHNSLIDEIDIKKAKKSGEFLDGCTVYLIGFNNDDREKLCKILNASGGTRCDDMSDRVTHIIVGDRDCHEFNLIRSKNYSCSFVTLQWLKDCIDNKKLCSEEQYLVNAFEDESNFKSPLGIKGLSLLRTNKTITECDLNQSKINTDLDKIDIESEKEMMKAYLPSASTANDEDDDDTLANILKNANYNSNQNFPQSQNTKDSANFSEEQSTLRDSESQGSDLFHSLTFLIAGYDDDQEAILQEHIINGSGTITKNITEANYILVPIFIDAPIENYETTAINNLWIDDSVNEQELVPIKYYHRPLVISNSSVLDNFVVTLSGYIGCERKFLLSLINELGGISQEQFCRFTSKERNTLATTHLVTAEASGKKYQAALKWGIPAVSKNWLLTCTKQEVKVSEEPFLVTENSKKDDSITTISHMEDTNLINKENIQSDKSKSSDKSTKAGISAYSDSSKDSPIPPISKYGTSTSRDQNAVVAGTSRDSTSVKTPERRKLDEPFSQVTPVEKIMKEVRLTNLLGTPASPQLARAPWEIDTPETPYETLVTRDPSKTIRKEIVRFLNKFPDDPTPIRKQRRLSTPLSELKRQLWAKIDATFQSQSQSEDPEDNEKEEENEAQKESTQTALVNTKLQQLEEMMQTASPVNKSRRQSRAPVNVSEHVSDINIRDSQPCTVQWDYGKDTQEESPKIFMLSGIPDKIEIINKLQELGAIISESNSYDPSATHLICPKPARNEKILASMAAGKWILHINYVDASVNAGKFLNEEDYEFGNPNSIGKISIELDRDIESRMQAIHYWRNQVARTGRGAFHDLRAIVIADKRQALVSVIEAGGGTVIDVKPPFDEIIHVTHCLMEPKSVSDFTLYEPLAKQGIYCMNTLYVSDFLHRKTFDIKNSILPFFQKHFK